MNTMTLGTSTVLVAVGAIMRYAITAQGDGFDIPMIGGILMLVGLAGALVTFALFSVSRQRRVSSASVPRTVIVEKREVV